MSDIESIGASGGFFEEPEDFRPPVPQAHSSEYIRTDISPESDSQLPKLQLRLVGTSPLWGHLLWNAGIYTAKHLDQHIELVKGKTVLELGAAGALPSIVAALIGAKKVVSTDYPDADLLNNIQYNVKSIVYDAAAIDTNRIVVEGYIWGHDYLPLQKHIGGEDSKFDLIILSDLVFNHSEHHKLLRTVKDLLASDGKALVVFSPHRPKLLGEDLQFFETCKEFDLRPEFIEMVNWRPMFDEDHETVEIRSRVYAYYLTQM
ncbi:hypothetical protein HG535_0G02370 [Zygotorulaspora mrakii]|uniref:Protein N-terminal and lysine N-methyltransferase EFM7 n=1 Tax=Zygotorulaspora mrakii TaxID=42260 RepID=A0A7H9B775_ZYGMR|nr:uncharacterized protein HG535_0G02370 [Zygotorulaspora mrakii]QLG74353.1 hypothetical protein HG535_0G02370 [Zygotorulaspora mrakii]